MSEKESDPVANPVSMSKDTFYGMLIIGLAALLVISTLTQGFGLFKPAAQEDNQTAEQGPSDAELKSKMEKYINENLLAAEYSAEVTKLEPFDSHLKLASINIKQGGALVQATQAYISNDGSSIFLGQIFNLNETPAQNPGTQGGSATKVAKPKAQAFIMSFCPYGLQFLKAYVPVMELLGDKADLEINFVDYAMHGAPEIDANNYIYCVQKEEKAKLSGYLRCFVEEGDYQGCVATEGIDGAKLASCISQLDAQYNITGLYNDPGTWAGGVYPPYPVESALNGQYGVRGSPTFILNGESVSVSRSAEAIKQAVCATFEQPPAECSTTLRTEEEAPGVGAMGSGSASTGTASCG